MSLLWKFPQEDYGMTEHIKKLEEDKKINKLNKKNKKEQSISLEIFYNFDGWFKNNPTNDLKKQKKIIDEQALNLDIYNALMNNGGYYNRRRTYNDILDF